MLRVNSLVGFGAGGAQAVATFVGISAIKSTTTALALPGGSAAGDLCLLIAAGNTDVSCTGFTAVAGDITSSPSKTSFAYKVLTSGNISSPPTVTVPSSGGYFVAVYRGATVLTKKSATNSTSTTAVVTGFTKATGCKRVIACSHDGGGSGNLAAPTGFADRGGAATTYFSHNVYDKAPADYSGENVTCNLFSGANGVGTLLELT